MRYFLSCLLVRTSQVLVNAETGKLWQMSEYATYRELAQGKLCDRLIFQGRTQPDKMK
jgi:hypothetical protein